MGQSPGATHGATSTLRNISTPDRARRARNLRRIGIVAMLCLVVAASVGALGVRSREVSNANDVASVRVLYPQVTRAGLAVPLQVVVESEVPLPKTLHVNIGPEFFRLLDFQNVYPQPESARNVGESLQLAFRTDAGTSFEFFFDVRTGPDRQVSSDTFELSVETVEGPLAVEFSVKVMP